MEPVRTHVAGADIHKDIIVITALIGEFNRKPEVIQFECKTFTEDLVEAAIKLREMGIQEVTMESTGIYWRPVFKAWHQLGLKITLANATHVKNVPGRKTDLKDSHWLAQLHRCGLIKASFIPEQEFQDLRSLTRHRRNLIEDTNRVKNRILKMLEGGNIKLGSVASDVFGVGGMAVLEAIADGVTDDRQLVSRIQTSLKKKGDELRKSLTNSLTKVDCYVIKNLISQYKEQQLHIQNIEAEIDRLTEKHNSLIVRLCEIPGIKEDTAKAIIAEVGADVDAFESDRHFAAWAGVAPGNRESAGKKKELAQDMEALH